MWLWMRSTDFGRMLCKITFWAKKNIGRSCEGHWSGCFLPDQALTLTEKHKLWKIPEGSLYHIEVATAHTVHECWQEVCCQAAAERTYTITS